MFRKSRAMLLSPLDSLYKVWEEADLNSKSIKIKTKHNDSILFKGIKIVNSADGIKIYNTKKGSLNYKEIDYDDYIYFLDKGFISGVFHILKRTYKEQIDTITQKIQNEVNQRNNKKHYDYLKQKRDNIIKKYTQIIKKEKL
tara:strand:- start:1036 stop:1461 length:426 start_codon:yes stop_codon:yes gene_type:complete